MAVAVEELLNVEISRPARYLGTELGAVHKSWAEAKVRWALTYPEVYEVGASNLGHIILYNILNAQPRQLCDRAYLPASDLATRLRQTQTPLFAVESRRPLLDFDILGFSLSYELGATNILEMLDLAGIPLTWQGRAPSRLSASADPNFDHNRAAKGLNGSQTGSLHWPLIFAGGQTATSNPEPYADFFDFIALGDGEELLPEIGLVVEEGKAKGFDREALLLDLAQIPGVYVPQFYHMSPDGSVQPRRSQVPARIVRRVATPLPAYSIGLVPYVQTVHDRLTIEIRRGCTRGCRFCQPGMLTRPARDVAPDQVIGAIDRGMRQTGYNEFSLLSLSCSDYLALPALGVELKNRLRNENISLSLPSQRVDRFDENIAHILGGTRKTGLTFAPEAGSQRLRDIINKGLSNEELLRGVKTAYDQGWTKIKLYFMIGLPGETDGDVVGIAETVRWLRRECQGRKRLDFNLTISNFTPKPHTPFQWHSVSTEEFQRKQALLKAEFRGSKGIKVNFTDVRLSAMEDFVGRGDRRLAPVIQRAWELGAGMDAWWETLDRAFAAWTEAIAEAGLTWKYRQVDQGEWNLFGEDQDRAAGRETPIRESLAGEISVREDLVGESSVREGWVEETSVREDLVGETSIREDLVEETSVREDLAEETSIREDLVEETSIREDLAEESSVREDLAEESSIREDLAEESSVREIPVGKNSVKEIPNSGGQGQITGLDRPLPWDHLDTGIDKKWLQEDLHRALAAATVPDCSFEGCSHCGVCGVDFGHNVVVPAPVIPQFQGQFQPNQARAQRLRLWFGKQGELRLLGHLDLMRLWERAVRRAGLPIAFSGGFHPAPRLIPANALPLGMTSSGEILDLELTVPLDPQQVYAQLQAQLPIDLPLYRIQTVALSEPAITAALEEAHYTLQILALTPEGDPQPWPSAQWQAWIQTVLARDSIVVTLTGKSGKPKQVNLRDRLTHLSLLPPPSVQPGKLPSDYRLSFAQSPGEPIGSELEAMQWPQAIDPAHVFLHYQGSCRNDGTLLRPEHLVLMLGQISQQDLHLGHAHRDRLI